MNDQNIKFFFSYSRKDLEFVLKLASDLRKAETNFWLDKLDIAAGERWDDSIQAALISCQGLLAVISPNSASSQNCQDEISYALDEGKWIIPVLYQKCTIPFRLRRLQYVDFSEDYDKGLTSLLDALKQTDSKMPFMPNANDQASLAVGANQNNIPNTASNKPFIQPGSASKVSNTVPERPSDITSGVKPVSALARGTSYRKIITWAGLILVVAGIIVGLLYSVPSNKSNGEFGVVYGTDTSLSGVKGDGGAMGTKSIVHRNGLPAGEIYKTKDKEQYRVIAVFPDKTKADEALQQAKKVLKDWQPGLIEMSKSCPNPGKKDGYFECGG